MQKKHVLTWFPIVLSLLLSSILHVSVVMINRFRPRLANAVEKYWKGRSKESVISEKTESSLKKPSDIHVVAVMGQTLSKDLVRFSNWGPALDGIDRFRWVHTPKDLYIIGKLHIIYSDGMVLSTTENVACSPGQDVYIDLENEYCVLTFNLPSFYSKE